MTLTRYCLFLLVALLSSPVAWAEDRWVEGQHYQTLNPPVAVGRGTDVVVTEFFWYGCGHCYTFEPMLTAWGKQLPEGAVLQPSPAVWNDPMRIHAKAYYLTEVLGVKETVHPVIFDAMHVDRKRLVSRLELRDLFEENGVDPYEKFSELQPCVAAAPSTSANNFPLHPSSVSSSRSLSHTASRRTASSATFSSSRTHRINSSVERDSHHVASLRVVAFGHPYRCPYRIIM